MATENQHKPNDFTPVVKALELANYVLQITANNKWFPDCSIDRKKNNDGSITQIVVYRIDSMTNIVREEARRIFLLVHTANEINLKRQPKRKAERLRKQVEATALCDDLLADIQLCQKHFHLTSKRTKYWGELVINLRSAIERWHESDKDRYKDI